MTLQTTLFAISSRRVNEKCLFCLYLQLSILVHPDKNQDDEERAQKAFEGTPYLCNTALNLCLLVSPADNLGKQF